MVKQLSIFKNDKSFSESCPQLLKEWDYEKNNKIGLYPDEIVAGSSKYAYWKCDKGHSWKTMVHVRARKGASCPVCSGHITLSGYNDFTTLYPELLKEWDYEENEKLGLDPTKEPRFSYKKAWWNCPYCNNKYFTRIANRSRGCNCPECAKVLKTSFPEQVIYFYMSQVFKNVVNRYLVDNIEIDIFIPELNLGIEYDGIVFHNSKDSMIREQNKYKKFKKYDITLIRVKEKGKEEYFNNNCDYMIPVDKSNNDKEYEKMIFTLISIINLRFQKSISIDINLGRDRMKIYSNYIIAQKENSLEKKFPKLVKEWNYQKNLKIKPSMVIPESTRKVWWKCDKGHSWMASINSRTRENGNNCPICANQVILKGYNDLETRYPQIAKEWDYNKNSLLPSDVFPGSNKKYWWICSKGHSYQATPDGRVYSGKHTGCPVCNNKIVLEGYNDVKTTNPELLKKWDYEENEKIGIKPTNITKGSDKIINWKCDKGHKFKCSIGRMNRVGIICPVCNGKKIISGINDFMSQRPELMKEWDYKKNNKLGIFPDKVSINSNKRAWWKCNRCGKEWIVGICTRTRGRKCPVCSKIEGGKKHTELLVNKNGSLKHNYPELLKEWDYEKNNVLGIYPDKVTSGSHKKVWWKCNKCNYNWYTEIRVRTRKSGCPKCAGKIR